MDVAQWCYTWIGLDISGRGRNKAAYNADKSKFPFKNLPGFGGGRINAKEDADDNDGVDGDDGDGDDSDDNDDDGDDNDDDDNAETVIMMFMMFMLFMMMLVMTMIIMTTLRQSS